MHKASCPEGRIQSGNTCIDATTTKASIVGCVDFDLSKVAAGSTATMCDGSTGLGTLQVSTTQAQGSCTTDGQVGCLTTSTFKPVNTSTLNASKIALGTTIAGITGTKYDMKQCRNASNLSLFDTRPAAATVKIPEEILGVAANTLTIGGSGHGLATNNQVQIYCTNGVGTQMGGGPVSVGTNYYAIVMSGTGIRLEATIAGGALTIASTAGCTGTWVIAPTADLVAQNTDTIDDSNGTGSTAPSSSPWGSDYLCNESNFTNKTGAAPLAPSNTIPTHANQTWNKIWRDELTGLHFTNTLHTAGGPSDWYMASVLCTNLDALNGGNGGSGWRLPTQKELMQLYINGVSKIALGTSENFWTSTAPSFSSFNAYAVFLADGSVSYNSRSSSNSVICVR